MTEIIQQLYFSHVCGDDCTHELITLSDKEIDDILNSFAQALHNGELKGNRIHSGLYFETARKLTEAITKGTGEASFSWDDPNNALKAQLMTNVHKFSGAKSLTENAVFSNLLTDDKGDLKPFNQFLNDIRGTYNTYNKDYLSAEYNAAVAQAQTGILWNQYSDEDWLKYSTAGDERVRVSHAALDGIIQKKSSAFWLTHWPPLDWSCRCTAVPASKPAQPLTAEQANQVSPGAVAPGFAANSGLTGIVFDNSHPYFKANKNIEELDAVTNYGLKTVPNILKQPGLSAADIVTTETDYYAWWETMMSSNAVNKTDFAIADKMGNNTLFDADFKTSAPFNIASNSKDILTAADELWAAKDVWNFVKYYDDGMYVLQVQIEDSILKAKKLLKANKQHYRQVRKGVLIK